MTHSHTAPYPISVEMNKQMLLYHASSHNLIHIPYNIGEQAIIGGIFDTKQIDGQETDKLKTGRQETDKLETGRQKQTNKQT
jgi:hypothetical protein